VVSFTGICKPRADSLIAIAEKQGYKLERFAIFSPDYYKFWYNEDPGWQPNEGHGVGLVRVNGKEYLIEPTIPMAWELNKPYAGTKVGVSWE